jgi:hypothetical protein
MHFEVSNQILLLKEERLTVYVVKKMMMMVVLVAAAMITKTIMITEAPWFEIWLYKNITVYHDSSVFGYCSEQFDDRLVPMFWRNLLHTSSGQKSLYQNMQHLIPEYHHRGTHHCENSKCRKCSVILTT